MAAPRRFDREEAQRRFDAGETCAEIAASYGVHRTAVYQVVTEAGRRAAQVSRENQRRRTVGQASCDRCGAPMNLVSRQRGSRLCQSCALDDNATSVRPNELRCCGCKQWYPDEAFYRGGSRKRRRGRKNYCRSCDNQKRREYRARNPELERAYNTAYSRRRRSRLQKATSAVPDDA